MKKSDYTENILRKYSDARSDDNLLIYIHLKQQGLVLSDEQVKQLQEISKETVSLYDLVRYRQKIQAKGEYLGTPEIMEKRRKKGIARRKKEREEKYNIVQPTRIEPIYGIDNVTGMRVRIA